MKELCLKYGIVVCPKSEPTRRMVLGTDNQEKDPPTHTVKTYLPWLPSCLGLLPCIQTCPPFPGALFPQKPTQIFPLVETGGQFGPTWVHKSFSLLELRDKQDLGSYTDDPGKYIDTSQHITLAFALMWKDIMVIFSQTLSDLEHARVLKEA